MHLLHFASSNGVKNKSIETIYKKTQTIIKIKPFKILYGNLKKFKYNKK